MEETCECKGCGGKVFLSIVVTAVVMALGIGGYMMWWANNNDDGTSSTASTAAKDEAVKLDASKGSWSDTGNGNWTYSNTSIDGSKITIGIPMKPATKVDETAWQTFVKSLKVIQGQDTNNLIVVPSDYKSEADGLTLMGIGVVTIPQWRGLKDNATGNIVDVSKNGTVLVEELNLSLDEGEVPGTAYAGVKDEIVSVFGKGELAISYVES
jgi:uncharacterized protein (UPF0333 family)